MFSVAAAPGNSYRTLWDQGPSTPNALVVCVTSSSAAKLSQKTRDAGQPGASTFPQLLCLGAGAHDLQLAWHRLTFLGMFSLLCQQSLTLQQKGKQKEEVKKRPTVLQ